MKPEPKMPYGYLKAILSDVKYLDWKWRIMDKGDGFLIQLVWDAPDCHSGVMKEQHGRKWYVSSFSCDSEVVQTAYAAVQRAVLHEAAEQFLYKGRRIFNPHFDVDALVEIEKLETRS